MTDASGMLNFSADRPIATLKDDLLGRAQFAISLANAICVWNGTESLVIAIYGPWGTGKSSVKNMVVSLLHNTQDAPTVVEFNPWEWSGENRLLEAFFDEIETALRKGAKAADVSDLSKKWKKYSSRLTLGSTALEHLRIAAEVAGMPWVPLVLGTLSSALKQSAAVGQEAADAHAAAAEAESESLATLKSSLHDALSRLQSPVLVVIDDVDRLHPEEIRTLFRLVKINADFPNMIYLLLFDRRIIENALDDASGDTGRSYMEKIVQAGFDLPQVQQSALDQALTTALDALLDNTAMSRTFDGQRWQSLYLNGLRHYCSSLRHIRRFVSSLSFQMGLFIRDTNLEVNVVDLIGLEALRVFEPNLYHTLSQNPHLVFGDRHSLSRDRQSKEEKSKKADRLLSFAQETSRTAAKGILRELFPQVDWLLTGHDYGIRFEDGWLRDLRMCHRDMFSRYFVMSVPAGDISVSLLDSVLAVSGDRAKLREQLLFLIEKNEFVALLQRLEAYKKTLDLAHAETFATALFDVGDALPTDFGGLFGLTPDMIACRIVHHYLMQDQDYAHRSQTLLRALNATDGTWLPTRIVAIEEPQPEKHDWDNCAFDAEGLEQAKAICLEKIRQLALADELPGPRLSFYLWRWSQWGGEAEPRAWVAAKTEDLLGMLKVLEGFVQQVHVSSGRASYIHYELKFSNVAPFVDIERVRALIEPLLSDPIPDELRSVAHDHQVTIRAVRKAFRRKEEGKAEDDWGYDDDE